MSQKKKTTKSQKAEQQKQPKIHIKNLKKSFGSKKVLKGINLDVFEGESVVIIGGSGTGKSVLLKCLLGLMDVDSGSMKMNGIEKLPDGFEKL